VNECPHKARNFLILTRKCQKTHTWHTTYLLTLYTHTRREGEREQGVFSDCCLVSEVNSVNCEFYTHSSSERVRYFTERVQNVRSDQKIKNALRTRSFRCFRRTTTFNFWTGDFCIHFGCVSITCKIKRFIINRTVY